MRKTAGFAARSAESLACLALIVVPPIVLTPIVWKAFTRRADAILAQTAPIASAEATKALGRGVVIKALSPGLSVSTLTDYFLNRNKLGTLKIHAAQITIAGNTELGEGDTLASANGVTADLSVPDLLTGNIAQAVPRIVIESPTVSLVRNKAGRLNLLDLIPKPKPDAKPTDFRTVVVVSNGKARLTDFAAKLPAAQLPAVNSITNLSGTVDLSEARRFLFAVSANAMPGTTTVARLGGTVRVSGSAARNTKSGESSNAAQSIVRLHAQNTDIGYWLRYFLNIQGVRINKGRADADIALVSGSKDKKGIAPGLILTGTAAVRDGNLSLGFLPAPLQVKAGTVQFGEHAVYFDASGSFLGAPLVSTGSLWNFGYGHPQINATLRSEHIPVKQITAAFFKERGSLPGALKLGYVGAINAYLSGDIVDPIVAGQVAINELGWQNYPRARNVHGNIAYSRGIIALTGLSGNIDGKGSATGQLAARLGERTPKGLRLLPANRRELEFAANLRGVPMASLQSLLPRQKNSPPIRLAGSGNAQIIGTLQNGAVDAAANIAVNKLGINTIRFTDARARLVVAKGKTAVPYLSLVSDVGAARVQGSMDNRQNIALKWQGRGLDVGKIAALFGVKNGGGLIGATGTVDGTIAAPHLLVNNLRGLGIYWGNYRADLLTGSLSAIKERLTLGKDVRLYRFPARVEIAGTVGDPLGRRNLDINVAARGIDLEEIRQQLGLKDRLPVNGIVSLNKTHLTGTADNPKISGDARLAAALASDYVIENGALHFDYDKQRTRLTDFVVRTDAGEAQGNATLLQNGKLYGAFHTSPLSLERLSYLTRSDITLDGKISLSGTVGGTLKKPVVNASAAPTDIAIADIPIRSLNLRGLTYTGDTDHNTGKVTLPQLSFGVGKTQANITDARYDPKSGRFGAHLSAQSGSIADLENSARISGLGESKAGASFLTALNRLPRVDGAFDLRGADLTARIDKGKGLTDIAADADLSATGLAVGQIQGIDLSTKASLKNDRIVIDRFVVNNEQTTVTARGNIDLKGDVNVTLDSNEASLDLVRAFIPNFPLSGTVNLTATARGSHNAPIINASVDSSDLIVKAGNGTSIPLSLVQIRAALSPVDINSGEIGHIVIEDSRIQSKGNELDLQGDLPFSYKNRTLLEDRPIRLSATLPPQDADLLTPFLPGLHQKTTPVALPANSKAVKNQAKPTRQTIAIVADNDQPVRGDLLVTGTLQEPILSGGVQLQNLAYSVPRAPGETRDRFSPIDDIRAKLRFDGAKIVVDEFALQPGNLNGQVGSSGLLTAQGSVTLQNLQNLLRRNRETTRASGNTPSVGTVDMSLNLDKLRLGAETVFGNFGARGSGVLTVKGALEQPLIASADNQPLRLTDAYAALSAKSVESGGTAIIPINPKFNINLQSENRAVISQGNNYRFETDGNAQITGSLAALAAHAALQAQGGYYNYALARFRVKRGGDIEFILNPNTTRAVLRDVSATAVVYAPAGVTPTLDYRASGDTAIPVQSTQSVQGGSSRYSITLTLNGPLILGGDPASNSSPAEQAQLSFTSDPPLDSSQILALIGTQQQVELAARGNIQTALQQGLTQALTSNVVPGLLSGLEQSVATALGFEEFGIDYGVLDTNAPLTFQFIKRFPDPLNRFLLSYKTTITTRNQLGQQQPFLASIYYELYELRFKHGIRPRLQLGVSQDELKTQTIFLRGAIYF